MSISKLAVSMPDQTVLNIGEHSGRRIKGKLDQELIGVGRQVIADIFTIVGIIYVYLLTIGRVVLQIMSVTIRLNFGV